MPAERQGDDLGILAADVQDGAGFGIEVMGAQGVGLDFRDGTDLQVRQLVKDEFAAVAGGNDGHGGQGSQDLAALGQRIKGGGQPPGCHYLAVFQHHQFDGPGTDVDSGCKGILLHEINHNNILHRLESLCHQS